MTTTFAITAMGRSGTRSLAAYLNASPTWTVAHEPHNRIQTIAANQARFEGRERYGEVNGYLRFSIAAMDVGRRAIVIRDPIAIVESQYNRTLMDDRAADTFIASVNYSFHALAAAEALGVRVFLFPQVVKDPTEIARYVGVVDVDGPLPQLNATDQRVRVRLTEAIEDKAHRVLGWAREYFKV